MAVYLAALDGRDVGMITLRLVPYLDQDAPYAEITEIYVEPDARRKGVAPALTIAAEQAARSAAPRPCTSSRAPTTSMRRPSTRPPATPMPNVSFENS